MTDGNVNIQSTKKWYQKLWGKVLATIAIFGTLGVILEFIIIGVNWYNSQQETFDKVNALEKIAIPDLKETVHYIESGLEENERDMFILMKMVKENLEQRKSRATEQRS